MTERLLLRPEEAAEVLGIGRSKLYVLLAEGATRAHRRFHDLRRANPTAVVRAEIDMKTAFTGGDGHDVRRSGRSSPTVSRCSRSLCGASPRTTPRRERRGLRRRR